MRWDRAVHHVRSLADSCAQIANSPAQSFMLRVTQLWAVGDVLGEPRELETVTVALCVDLPVDEVPWWGEPHGAEHWANSVRLNKNPVLPWWRSAHAPVWNHRIDRPALVWDIEKGISEDTLAAIRDGLGEGVREPAPDAAAYDARLSDELAVSLRALRHWTREYEERRWRPGKIAPVADALWRAGDGYLDVLSAVDKHQP